MQAHIFSPDLAHLKLIIPVFVAFMVRPVILKLVHIVDQVKFAYFLGHFITVHGHQTFIFVRYGFDTADLNKLTVFRL